MPIQNYVRMDFKTAIKEIQRYMQQGYTLYAKLLFKQRRIRLGVKRLLFGNMPIQDMGTFRYLKVTDGFICMVDDYVNALIVYTTRYDIFNKLRNMGAKPVGKQRLFPRIVK